MIINQINARNETPSLYMEHDNMINMIPPDSPTLCALHDSDSDTSAISDLALAVSDQLIHRIATATTTPSLSSSQHVKDDDEDSLKVHEEDTSLVLARNHLSASFSKWEFDPEDGSFHNSNQLMLWDDNDDDTDSDIPMDGKKRVSFMEDPMDKKLIYCQVITNEYELTCDDITNSWYTATEVKKFRQSSHRCAYFARQLSCHTYNDMVIQLHKLCSKSVHATKCNTLALNVSSSRHRGLEQLIFFELFRGERKTFVQDLLQLQNKLYLEDNSTDDEIMAQLGTFSQLKSRRSRRFAYMMAVGDAEIAIKQYTAAYDMELIIKKASSSSSNSYNKRLSNSRRTTSLHRESTSSTTTTTTSNIDGHDSNSTTVEI